MQDFGVRIRPLLSVRLSNTWVVVMIRNNYKGSRKYLIKDYWEISRPPIRNNNICIYIIALYSILLTYFNRINVRFIFFSLYIMICFQHTSRLSLWSFVWDFHHADLILSKRTNITLWHFYSTKKDTCMLKQQQQQQLMICIHHLSRISSA